MPVATRDGHDPTGVEDRVLQELAGWAGAIPADAQERLAAWPDEAWVRFRRLVLMHGLAAVLADRVRASGAAGTAPASVPEPVQAWLADQEEQVARRADRLRADLAAILQRAAARGIAVMPLKGAALVDVPAIDARRRPMADLDLLVRPSQRAGMRAVLEELGYRRRRRPEAGPKPETFRDAGGGVVVEREGEHPDNPRPVELHLAVDRHLWEWIEEDRLTAAMWASGTPGVVAGQPAILAPMTLVFQHLAMHATTNLMRGHGRLLQWLDLARLAGAGAAPASTDSWLAPRLAYPSLAMASRVLPAIGSAVDLDSLSAESRPVVVRWARESPLDGRAGLETGRPRIPPGGEAGAAERWRPSRLRLAVAYGPAPLPVALGSLALAITRYGVRFSLGQIPWRLRRLARPVSQRVRSILRRRQPASP